MSRKHYNIILILLTVSVVLAGITVLAGNHDGVHEGGNNSTSPPDKGPSDNTESPREELNNTYPDFNGINESNFVRLLSFNKKQWASFLMEDELEVNSPPQEVARFDSVQLLQESLKTYRSAQRVADSQTFDKSHRALRRISRLDNETISNLSSLATLQSDRETAELAVEDADRGLELFDISTEDEKEAQKKLSDAREHLADAERKSDAGSVPTVIARANAVKEYGKAWQDAQEAIDILDDDISPSVDIRDATYEPRKGFIEVSLEGRVDDIRAYEYDNATVFVNGERFDEIELNTVSRGPFSPSTFDTRLELGQLENEIEVRVSTEGQSAGDTFEFEAKGFADDVYSLNYTNQETDVGVEATGQGLAPDDIQVINTTPDEEPAASAGPQVEIDNTTTVQNATVSIPIYGSVNTSERNLSIVTWEVGETETARVLDTDIDERDRVARADVRNFSRFWLLDVSSFPGVRTQ